MVYTGSLVFDRLKGDLEEMKDVERSHTDVDKRGRPRKDEAKNIKYEFRMDFDDWEKLTKISEDSGMTKADILRRLIRKQYTFEMFSD